MKYLLIIPVALFLVGCCGENYVKEMEGLSQKTTDKLLTFYQTKHKYPKINERNSILESLGCKMISENVCSFNGRKISVESKIYLKNYRIYFTMGKNFCDFGINEDGSIDNVSCRKDDCISLKQ